MATVFFTRLASNDLLAAWDYLAEESPSAADRVLDIINSETQLLVAQPLMGRQRPEFGRGVRSWPTSTPYILFYLVKGDDIYILRVLHHARDIQHVMANPDL